MSMLEVYVHEIKQYIAMAPCDHTLKQFVLQDGVAECGKLKVNIIDISFLDCIEV